MPKKDKETVSRELTIINEPSQAIALYKITPAEIAERLKAYAHLKVIEGDTASYKEVRAALTALVHTRTEVDKRRLKLGEELRKSVTNINKASKMLIEPMTPYEERFSSELKAENDRLDAIKAEEIRLEEERVEDIRAEIHKIQEMAMPTVLGTMALENLRELSSRLEDMEIKETEYMELTEQAIKIIEDSYNAVQEAITARIKLDKEAEERRTESARMENVRLDQEAAQKLINEAAARHQAKIDTDNLKIRLAQKKIDDDKAELAAEKQADVDRKEREEFERQAKIKADKEAKEAQEQIERDKSAKATAQAAEKARQEALAPDKDKLIKWIESFNETAIPSPQLKSKEAKEIYRIAQEQIEMILQDAMIKIEEL